MDDWATSLGAGPQRRDRPLGWRDGQDRYGQQQERTGFARPRGLAAEPYQVGLDRPRLVVERGPWIYWVKWGGVL